MAMGGFFMPIFNGRRRTLALVGLFSYITVDKGGVTDKRNERLRYSFFTENISYFLSL